MPLTDIAVRKANPTEKPYRLGDAAGMYLEVQPSGAKYWRLRYRFDGKQKTLALGVYPVVSLKDARDARDDARGLLGRGIDPGAARAATKATRGAAASNSFEAIAREWHRKFSADLSASHAARNLRRLESHVFPYFGEQTITAVDAPTILAALQKVEERGNLETAHRLRSIIGQVFRYAIATARATRDPSADLRGAIPPKPVKHYAAIIDPAELGKTLKVIHTYQGSPVVEAALKLAPYLFQRPGEQRLAEWVEFDLDGSTWEIPPSRMKRTKEGKASGAAHIVPLARQVVDVLRDLHTLTGHGNHVFPSVRGDVRPISDGTLATALKLMGFDSQTITPHGWRATARTLAVEALGFPAEVVEMQLAHSVRDSLGRAYNRTQWLDKRRELMQAWADYLDRLRLAA
ncbi:integrase [Pandoraea iniqua]|uniref:Integrase n=1 Tax=Pandoraea iniqua TaxID=2508288 RepID=A0A5E4ULR4_9BURK|nr:integrase arm-type DNA-binding domain-containing protein [Pandoraea iniqua]VVE00971.1 integrase [Pandoraea iniqua]